MDKRLKKFLSLVVSFTVFFNVCCVYSFAYDAIEMNENSFINIKTTPEDLQGIKRYSELTASVNANGNVSLPRSVDLSRYLPAPGSQLLTGTCTSWVFSYCLAAEQTIRRGWNAKSSNHMFSPSFLHKKTGKDTAFGASSAKCLDILKTYGVCTLTYRPFSPDTVSENISSIQSENAQLYRITTFFSVWGIDEIKKALSDGHCVVIAIRALSDFETIGIDGNEMYNDYETKEIDVSKSQGHSICLVGYDENKKAFKFINSWGPTWGFSGYGWIAEGLLTDRNIICQDPGDKNESDVIIGRGVIIPSLDSYCMGDMNGDGKVTAGDARLALRFSSRLESYTDRQYVLADVDGDAKLTSTDASNILKYSSKQISKFPLYE